MNHVEPVKHKLHTAILAEKSDANERLLRYKSLSAKIADYQIGVGSAPTEDEFKQWLADVEYAVDLKKMLGGG